MSALLGSTRTAPICPTSGRPTNVHVLPASVDFHTPRPIETLLRMSSEPVPTYTTLGFDGATAIAPMEPTGILPSEIGHQLAPASVVFHTPPEATPI